MTPQEALIDLVREHLRREPYLTYVDIAELEYIDPYLVHAAWMRVRSEDKLPVVDRQGGVAQAL